MALIRGFSGGEYEFASEMVEYLSDGRVGRCMRFSSGVSQEVLWLVSCRRLMLQVLRGKANCLTPPRRARGRAARICDAKRGGCGSYLHQI